LRAELFLAEPLALLNRCRFQCPFRQTTRRRARDLLHLGEVHVESRPLFPEGMLDDNFSPLFGESLHRQQFFGRQLPCCHRLATLRLEKQGEVNSRRPILPFSLYGAKGVLHSAAPAALGLSCRRVRELLRLG
jgi:hypothetical protein